MRKVWIVVANSSLAKIYQAVDGHTLTEKKSFEHPETHLKDNELVTDRPGANTYTTGNGPHPIQEKTPQKVKERHYFADQIATYLQEALYTGEFEHLYLIANPTFLGHLRSAMNPHLSKLIVSEVHKDLTHMKPSQIRDYLPPVL